MEIKLTNVNSNYGKRLLIIVMKTFFFLLCTTVFAFSSNNSFSQDKVNIDTDKLVSVDEVFTIIKAQTDYTFIYQKGIFKNLPKVQLKKGSIQIKKLLEQSLSSDKLSYEVTKENTIIIKENPIPNKPIQQLAITGKVTDTSGEPLPNVTVRIKGTNKATATDFDGMYKITLSDNANILVFSSIGFEKQEIAVDNQTTINITLKEAVGQLDEIVINAGYYKTSRKESTGSISKISAETIQKQTVPNPISTLQGRVSGLLITPENGLAAGGFSVQIRGQNSLASGNEPLYIIDGVPYGSQSMSSPTSSSILNGNLSPFSLINPSDIESIEVLKDADATAIYGSRGANGIILITTKKGKEGKTSFNINVNSGIGKVANTLELLNTEQYLEMRREAFANDGVTPGSTDYDLTQWDQNRYTNWQDILLGGTAYINDIQASVSGGNSKTQFRLGAGYHSETTVYPDDNIYERASALANISHTSNDDRFKIVFSANYAIENNTLPAYNLLFDASNLSPNAPSLYDEDGFLNWENSTWTNPLAQFENSYTSVRDNLFINSVLSYKVTSNLEVKTNLGYNNSILEDFSLLPNTQYNPAFGIGSESSAIILNSSNRSSWSIEPQVNWMQNFGKSRLNIQVGTTFQKQLDEQSTLFASGFSNNSLLENLAAASNLFVLEDNKREYKYFAIFGRINYNYKEKYILNLTGRRDGSSRFGPNKQFANFGAIGAAWIFSKEDFFKENKILTFGKLRGSYGTSGNDQIGDYQFLDTYNVTSNIYNGITGLSPSRLFNPDFAWEENKKLELALELGLLNNRIQITAAYYNNISTNQLVGIPLPNTTGFNSLIANLDAKVKNSGVELDIKTSNFQKENFSWSTSFNITIPKNKLIEFPGIEESTFANQYVIGESLSIRKLYSNLGVNPNTGIYEFEDYNNDGIISAPDDRQFIVDTAPVFYGGFNNSLNYKSWDFNILFQFTKRILSNNLSNNILPGAYSGRNQPVEVLDRWQEPGDEASIQLFTAGFNSDAILAHSRFQSSNAVFSDASFIRLKNISFGYTLPESILNSANCRIYFQGQNLLTFTNYQGRDPEQGSSSSLGALKQFNFGVELNF